MRYASERDPQLVGLLRRASLGFLAGTVLLAVLSWRMHSELLATLGVVSLLFGIGSFWTLRVTWYEITADRLRIRCGPSRVAIKWENVVRVQPSRDRRNAPALSLDRLQIDYRQGNRWRSVLISPENRQQFLDDLCGVCGLIAEGDAYVRGGDAGLEAAPPQS